MRIGKGEADALGYTNRASEPVVNTQKMLEKQYVDFLNYQYSHQNEKSRKEQEEFLDARQSKIHEHVEVVDSSPAFLGRNPYSKER